MILSGVVSERIYKQQLRSAVVFARLVKFIIFVMILIILKLFPCSPESKLEYFVENKLQPIYTKCCIRYLILENTLELVILLYKSTLQLKFGEIIF